MEASRFYCYIRRRGFKEEIKRFFKQSRKKKDYHLVSALSRGIVNSKSTWLIDSGASRHMIGYKDVLSNFKKENFTSKVKVGDEASSAITGT